MRAKRVLFPHIPKCAGSSIKSQIQCDPRYVESYFLHPTWQCPEQIAKGEMMQEALIDKISRAGEWILYGHYQPASYYSLDYDLQILLIRDPIERLVSHYNFFRDRLDINDEVMRRHPEVAGIKSGRLSMYDFSLIDYIRYFYKRYYLKNLKLDARTVVLDVANINASCQVISDLLAIDVSPEVFFNKTSLDVSLSPDWRVHLNEDLEFYSELRSAFDGLRTTSPFHFLGQNLLFDGIPVSKRQDQHPAYRAFAFNPSLNRVLLHQKQVNIVFIHVGKCAGGSVLQVVKNAFPAEQVAVYEYHCFDADELLSEIVPKTSSINNFYYVVLLRDPVERWASSFNWDRLNNWYSFLLWDQNVGPDLHSAILCFSRVDHLAKELIKESPCDIAQRFAKAFHMGWRLSWYLPFELARNLPASRTIAIRKENVVGDTLGLLRFISISCNIPILAMSCSAEFPKDKVGYQNLYPSAAFSSLDSLTYAEINKLKAYLVDDYVVYDYCMRYLPRDS